MQPRLASITTHPIQSNAPLFKMLSSRGKIAVKVFYTWGQPQEGHVYDPDFKNLFHGIFHYWKGMIKSL